MFSRASGPPCASAFPLWWDNHLTEQRLYLLQCHTGWDIESTYLNVTFMIFDLINEMSHTSPVTSTTETIIFRTKKNRVGKYSHRWWKKKITFSQSLQTGKYLWVCLICFAFFGKSKRQFSLQRKRPFVFANASHPFLPSKKLFSQEKTAQAEIKGKHYLWKISLFEDKNHFTQCKCHLGDFTGRKVMGGRLAMTHWYECS